MKKIVTIIGTRPQFIKSGVVSKCFRNLHQKALTEIIIDTGQHYDNNMSNVFINEFDINNIKYSLNVSGGTHAAMTANMLPLIENILLIEQPDIVLVYGDTNSTLAAAIAASKLTIPIAHIEAGVRSFDMSVPEEVNRVITDRLSSLFFTPTINASHNLLKEGVKENSIYNVGDVLFDLVLQTLNRGHSISPSLSSAIPKTYILVTIHRQENVDSDHRLSNTLNTIVELAKDIPIVWPLHHRTRKKLRSSHQSIFDNSNILFLEPVSYASSIFLLSRAKAVVTDSGGIQKESFFLKIPCVTLRDVISWPETVEFGWNRLISPLKDSLIIKDEILSASETKGHDGNPFGDGHAAEKIAKILADL